MIKLIILDMDGTLYDLNDVLSLNYEIQVSFLQKKWNKSREDIITYLNENDIYPIIKEESKSATELFLKNGISRDEWNIFREENFDVSYINKTNAVSNDIIMKLHNKYKLILLSSNSHKNIKLILSHLGISENCFDNILCSDKHFTTNLFNKLEEMKSIATHYNVNFSEIISIGDRFNTDISPMLSVGGKGILLKAPYALNIVYADLVLNKLKSQSMYTFYDTLNKV